MLFHLFRGWNRLCPPLSIFRINHNCSHPQSSPIWEDSDTKFTMHESMSNLCYKCLHHENVNVFCIVNWPVASCPPEWTYPGEVTLGFGGPFCRSTGGPRRFIKKLLSMDNRVLDHATPFPSSSQSCFWNQHASDIPRVSVWREEVNRDNRGWEMS